MGDFNLLPFEVMTLLARSSSQARFGYVKPNQAAYEGKGKGARTMQNNINKRVFAQLPHRGLPGGGLNWYAWAREFYESKNRMNLLVAANQISKSSTQIRKAIDWATNVKLWPKLWPKHKPSVFWYFYPVANNFVEVEKKWIRLFMPREMIRDHPVYGWNIRQTKGEIDRIDFNSGVSIFMKSYSIHPKNLQTTSVDAMFLDEECPESYFSELWFRLLATEGYFNMVFTATLGQDMWRRAMEPVGVEEELFKDAHKQHVTMYDCLLYEDGTPGMFTGERIEREKALCGSEQEVQRRIYGRFVKASGLKYTGYHHDKSMVKPFDIPVTWDRYVGVDVGGGRSGDVADKAHCASIAFIAVRPDHQYGVVYKGWRGDNMLTTSGDIFQQFTLMAGDDRFTSKAYDWAAKDFGTISTRLGGGFVKAKKGAEGVDILNTLMKNGMLQFFDTDDLRRYCGEFMTVQIDKMKENSKDDFADAVRFAIMEVAWDYVVAADGGEEAKALQEIGKKIMKTDLALEIDERRRLVFGDDEEDDDNGECVEDGWGELEGDINYWSRLQRG
jgi:hypothetical protein